MAGSKINFVLAYAFLVVAPLVGLAGVLKAGRGLTAPPAIDGAWRLQAALPQSEVQAARFAPCDKVLAAIAGKAMVISQSGRNFALSVPGELPNQPKITGSGTLEGTTLRAALTSGETPDDGGCTNAHPLTMLATVDRQAGANILNGTLSVSTPVSTSVSATDCPSCSSVAFRAERQTAPAPKGDR